MISILFLGLAWLVAGYMLVIGWRVIDRSPVWTGHWRRLGACICVAGAPWVVMSAHWIVTK